MKLTAIFIVIGLTLLATPAFARQPAPARPEVSKADVPQNIADSVGEVLRWTEGEFLGVAEAMPEAKYSFIPSAGEFKGARSFAEQVKHVACANFAFFNQIEGKTPPEHCEKGGPNPAKTKAELVKYLRDSFGYGHRVLATINPQNALARVEGPYAGPNTRLGMVVTAVWHIADHYGQIVEYLRMNGLVPPATQQYPLAVR
jgi:DinB superfamily